MGLKYFICGKTPDLPDKGDGGEVIGDDDERLAQTLHGILRNSFHVIFPDHNRAGPSRRVLVVSGGTIQAQVAWFDWKFWEFEIVPLLIEIRLSRTWGLNIKDERDILIGYIRDRLDL